MDNCTILQCAFVQSLCANRDMIARFFNYIGLKIRHFFIVMLSPANLLEEKEIIWQS